MINRRTLLLGTAGVALSSFLASCQQAGTSALKVVLLEGAIPAEVLQKFKPQDEQLVSFKAKAQVADIFQALQQWQRADDEGTEKGDSRWWGAVKRWLPWTKDTSAGSSDSLVSLGDYWLESAIAQGLIEPLNVPANSLEKLPIAWQQLGSRDEKGLVEGLVEKLPTASTADSQTDEETAPQKISLWAAPYKVQALVVVYRNSVFPQSAGTGIFNSWQDLLLPDLTKSITLPDHPRLVIALAQKIQTDQFNAVLEASSGSDTEIMASLGQLNEQVKTYSSVNPLKALVNEDVKAVVCWSGDAIAATKRYRDLRIAIPEEGSLLSADMWVRPKGADMSKAAQEWIDFCWQIGPATQLSVSGKGISPIFLQGDMQRPDALAEGLLSAEVMQNSEPLLPIPAGLKSTYVEMWKQLRSGQNSA